MLELVLQREYAVDGTNGVLLHQGKTVCHTIELPWIGNKRMESCIPEGTYQIKRRFSPKFQHHFILENVPNRSYILIHPANDAQRELRGCIAPVVQLTAPGKGIRSVEAMTKLKKIIYAAIEEGEVWIKIVRG